MAQLMPLPLTVSCFSKIQIGFTFLVPAQLGSPRKRAVKRVCVCVTSAGPHANNLHVAAVQACTLTSCRLISASSSSANVSGFGAFLDCKCLRYADKLTSACGSFNNQQPVTHTVISTTLRHNTSEKYVIQFRVYFIKKDLRLFLVNLSTATSTFSTACSSAVSCLHCDISAACVVVGRCLWQAWWPATR